MKKIIQFLPLAVLALALAAFQSASGPVNPVANVSTSSHIPFTAVFDADTFFCDPLEAKHMGRTHNRINTLHMKEKGPENIIVHFKSKKYTGKDGKPDNNYVHFDILYNEGKIGTREDTHLSLTWKGKKYHVKNNQCKLNITNLGWSADKVHFTFSADFEAVVTAGGPDTTGHIFKGKIIEELVKSKIMTAAHNK